MFWSKYNHGIFMEVTISVTGSPIRIAGVPGGIRSGPRTLLLQRSLQPWIAEHETGPTSRAQLTCSSAKLIPRATWAVPRECRSHLWDLLAPPRLAPSAWRASNHRNSQMIAPLAVSSSVTGQTGFVQPVCGLRQSQNKVWACVGIVNSAWDLSFVPWIFLSGHSVLLLSSYLCLSFRCFCYVEYAGRRLVGW
jgi:hypothetical protein